MTRPKANASINGWQRIVRKCRARLQTLIREGPLKTNQNPVLSPKTRLKSRTGDRIENRRFD
ncbi:hypothetical protein [Bartonella apihabitans]|uniref:hypothetical protein n=1 Tax=uncultured Bartonella sp. TaxID=104108 RepID=UPI0025DAD909|nr:hypothetical protein [Bartonella apihabitans]